LSLNRLILLPSTQQCVCVRLFPATTTTTTTTTTMIFRIILLSLCLFGAANGVAIGGLRGKGKAVMQPEVVAKTLTDVERKWMTQAMALNACHEPNSTSLQASDCEFAQRSFVESCQKITEAVVQGSSGDKDDAKDYMQEVCSTPEMQHESMPERICLAFSNSLLDGMTEDAYSNRENLDTAKLCAGFLEKGDLNVIAKEEVKRQEEEEARRQEELKKEREAEAQRKEQERKAEEARRIAEEAEKARKEAEEKKEKAEEAKKEQEQKAEESKKKAEELKKAEAEAAAALEHVKNVSTAAAEATEHAKKLAEKKSTNATKAAVKSAPKNNVTASTEQKNAKKTNGALLSAHSLVTVKSCDARQKNARALIQEKLAMFGVQCEDMCKEMGVYPKCQCPGFAGQPADGDDNRACIAKNCQDPSSPCPNDAFMTCVHETTKVSTLQWDSLIQKFDHTMGSFKKSLAMLKSGGGLSAKDIQCPAPLFVADCNSAGFCVCVCKDPDNCPSTVETLSAEEAAKQAAEAHAWNEAGGPNQGE